MCVGGAYRSSHFPQEKLLKGGCYGTKQLNPTKLSTSITLHHITHSSSPTTNMMDMGLVNTSCGLIWKEGGSGESYGGPKSTKISLFK